MPWLDLDAELAELFDAPHVLSGDAALERYARLTHRESHRGMTIRKPWNGEWDGPPPAPGLPDYRPRTLETVEAEHRTEQSRKLTAKRRRYANDEAYRARVCAARNASRNRQKLARAQAVEPVAKLVPPLDD